MHSLKKRQEAKSQHLKIYTLGTSLRSLEDFIEILHFHDIESVIDVRSFPISKIPHFTKSSLETILRHEGIEYHFLGKELGGFRKGGYEEYSRGKEFADGIRLLEKIAKQKQSVIICAERFPWKCHRKYISGALSKKGWYIEHIIDKNRIWIPKAK